jgi:hypothetical protein
MKKLLLNSAFSRGEVLTRAQLKKVMGGDGSSGSGDDPACLDQCENAETDCNNGQVCQKVETPGCYEPYIPKKCVGVA